MAVTITATDDNRIRIAFPYDANMLAFVKNSFVGRQYDSDSKSWVIPATDQNLQKIRDNAGRLGDAKELLHRIQEKRLATISASQAFSASEAFALRDGLAGTLRPYQQAGVEFITGHAKNKAYIGDEMGLGKTITALAAIHQEQAYPALVICPAVVVGNWKREAETWLPGKTVQIIKTGKDTVDPKADVVIASYALAAVAKDKKFAQVVCDEAHYLKNNKAKRTELVVNIAKKAPRRLLLSGTPVTNKPKDLFSQLDVLDVTGQGNPLGTFFQFATRYCGGHQGRYGFEADGATNVAELNERMRDGVYLRRDKAQVLTELPEKQRQTLYLDATPDTKRRIREVHAAYEADRDAPGAALKAMTDEMVAVGLGKIEAASEVLDDFVDSGKKLIIFSNLKEVQQAVYAKARELGGAVHIFGEDSSEKRDQAVQAFQTDPNVKFAVCSLKAAGVGITLTAASDVLMIEQDWTPANLDQAEDRAHRMGQKNAVNITYLVTRDTIDDTLQEVIAAKRKVASDLSQPVAGEVLAKWKDGLKPEKKVAASKKKETGISL